MRGGGGGVGGNSTLCAVHQVESLAHGQHRFKVDVNAKENHMSGVCVCVGGWVGGGGGALAHGVCVYHAEGF